MWASPEDDSPLVKAVRDGNILKVALLLRDKPHLHATDHDGCGLLHLAIRTRKMEIIEMLLQHGVDANEFSKGRTALRRACGHGDLELVKILLGAGAEVGLLELYTAVITNDKGIVEEILQKNIGPDRLNQMLSIAEKQNLYISQKILQDKIKETNTERL